MYTGKSLRQLGQRKIDIDDAVKATCKLSNNLTSLPSFLSICHLYIALHFFRKDFWVLFLSYFFFVNEIIPM